MYSVGQICDTGRILVYTKSEAVTINQNRLSVNRKAVEIIAKSQMTGLFEIRSALLWNPLVPKFHSISAFEVNVWCIAIWICWNYFDNITRALQVEMKNYRIVTHAWWENLNVNVLVRLSSQQNNLTKSFVFTYLKNYCHELMKIYFFIKFFNQCDRYTRVVGIKQKGQKANFLE